MGLIRLAVLYTALALGANAALADPALIALREGSMKKLILHPEPKPIGDVAFLGEAEAEMRLSDFAGKYVLVNLWATWCAPCRKEMPGLNALQQEFGGDAFHVVTIATGRNKPAAIRRFFEETGVDALPEYRDPSQALARDLAVFGLPMTVILDPEGREIGRLRGDAEWDSDSARAIVAAMIAGTG